MSTGRGKESDSIDWSQYPKGDFFDEMISDKGNPRAASRRIVSALSKLSGEELESRRVAADRTVRDMGVSFTVYMDGSNIDRAWPFDLIPRVIGEVEWKRTEEGLKQRVKALNMFINDVYHDQQIFKDGVVPDYLLKDSKNFRPECVGVNPPRGVWAHICGCDLVRDADGKFYVLEDNLRVPSGVAYMLENREISKRVLPELFETNDILPVDDYPEKLLSMLASVSPRKVRQPVIVILTPGIFNSAYFEHAFLAQQLGVELVEQPLPAAQLEEMKELRRRSPLPLFADESVARAADIPRLVGAFDGINIKLMKCGGIGEALRMIAAARAHGLQIMLGCMVETSLAITAAAHLSPLVDYADLDGNLLISNDPFLGATVENGRLVLPAQPGLGVRRCEPGIN